MTKNLKLALAMFCLGALSAPVAMAQTSTAAPVAAPTPEFVAGTPNVPQLNGARVTPRNGVTCGPTPISPTLPPCAVPEPSSLPLVAVAALAAFAVLRRRK